MHEILIYLLFLSIHHYRVVQMAGLNASWEWGEVFFRFAK